MHHERAVLAADRRHFHGRRGVLYRVGVAQPWLQVEGRELLRGVEGWIRIPDLAGQDFEVRAEQALQHPTLCCGQGLRGEELWGWRWWRRGGGERRVGEGRIREGAEVPVTGAS